MIASSVGVDRPTEGDAGGLGHLVDHSAGAHVEELHAPELALADVALDLLLEQGALAPIVVGQTPSKLGHSSSLSNARSYSAGRLLDVLNWFGRYLR